MPGAEEVAGAALLEVGLGQGEAVGGGSEGFQALAGLGVFVVREEDAVALMGAAPDAAPELVELAEAEAVGIFDDHEAGVGNIDADLNDGGGHENVQVSGGEGGHDGLFFLRALFAVDDADAQVGEDLGLESVAVLLSGL